MISRLSTRNIIKVALAVLFFPLISLLVFTIGIGAKNKKVILEGGIYAAIFIFALALPGDIAAIAGIGSMCVSVVRSVMLRDLWIPRKIQKRTDNEKSQFGSDELAPTNSSPSSSFISISDTLSNVLMGIRTRAKQNKYRLPADTYVAILETCQILDSVIDAEIKQPLADAQFEYELSAVVNEYLPAVLDGYLAIPQTMVEDRQPNGKTPNEELVDQLQLLQAQAETLHNARHQHASADLTTTGNFLRERFGHHQQGGFDFGIK